jgi:hypothetical protein
MRDDWITPRVGCHGCQPWVSASACAVVDQAQDRCIEAIWSGIATRRVEQGTFTASLAMFKMVKARKLLLMFLALIVRQSIAGWRSIGEVAWAR